MKKLRAKQISMRTMMVAVFALAMTAVMSVSQEAAVMTSGWENFKTSMTNFFYNGLGGSGFEGIGIVIAVCGIAMAVISFVVHKMNPQSRLPGWFTCLVIAVLGTMLFGGIKPILTMVKWIRDTVFGWFITDKFGDGGF